MWTDFFGNYYFGVILCFDCFSYFWVRDGRFMEFLIWLDSIVLPWYMGIYSLGSLGVS